MQLNEKVIHPSLIHRAFFLILAISIFTLTISIGIEELAKVQPCKICRLQRCCYLSMGVLAISGIFFQKKKVIGFLILLLAFSSLLLSFYHIGIQLGIFSDTCAVKSPADLNHFKKMLFQIQPSCASISLYLWLPISAWSLLFSLINVCVMIRALRPQSSKNSRRVCSRISTDPINN